MAVNLKQLVDEISMVDEDQDIWYSPSAEFGKAERLFRLCGMPFRFSGTLRELAICLS